MWRRIAEHLTVRRNSSLWKLIMKDNCRMSSWQSTNPDLIKTVKSKPQLTRLAAMKKTRSMLLIASMRKRWRRSVSSKLRTHMLTGNRSSSQDLCLKNKMKISIKLISCSKYIKWKLSQIWNSDMTTSPRFWIRRTARSSIS